MICKNTIVALVIIAITVILQSSCSAPSQGSKPPTTVQPTLTLSPTPEVIGSNPSPRGYVSMAYDSESEQVKLFGGQAGIYTDSNNSNNETWAFDVATNTWKEMKPNLSPPAGQQVY